MKIKPIGERVLVKPVEVEEKTAGGIILPGASSKEKPNTGEVVALGRGEKLEDITVSSKVIYSKYAGTEIKDGESTLILLNVDDVLAIIEE